MSIWSNLLKLLGETADQHCSSPHLCIIQSAIGVASIEQCLVLVELGDWEIGGSRWPEVPESWADKGGPCLPVDVAEACELERWAKDKQK